MSEVANSVCIPEEELDFIVGTSAGPGGQNVNRVQTRVTACFNVLESPSLSHAEKERVLERLANRINKNGVLKLRSQKHRTQRMNRTAAIERLGVLLAEALYVPPARRPARPPRAANQRRLEEKRRRGRIKEGRSRTGDTWETG